MEEAEKKHLSETVARLDEISGLGRDTLRQLQHHDVEISGVRSLVEGVDSKVEALSKKVEAQMDASKGDRHESRLWYLFSFFFAASFCVWGAGFTVGNQTLLATGTLSIYAACAFLMFIVIGARRRARAARLRYNDYPR